ncbi:nucleotidyltransferase family protein [Aurantimicrobium minutum]|uniref:nucleotidyltransferase family protein n=1 Tax=Aurantimicrobium minutum TaxID=708131 RepID=UPI002474B1AB|nr:nucleotidyltransferase family protein [Aurantimicrobium minutum]MDH6256025.1 dTDP-glucose pyrophosphorylase [Aurantimicrobium minutum]
MIINRIYREKLHEIIISPSTSLSEALRRLDQNELKIILVEDQEQKLVGTVTDGDVRRGLIKGFTLDTNIEQFMNKNFFFVQNETSQNDVKNQLIEANIIAIPEISLYDGSTTSLYTAKSQESSGRIPNVAIIMAGGLGKRMKAHTAEIPKPLLRVGNSTLIDHVIEQCIAAGIRKFYISVNYLKEQIIDHLGDGSHRNIEIKYLIENQRLGTAGSLSLLNEVIEDPFIVLNADVLHRTELREFIKFHNSEKAFATVGARHYENQIPFGVLRINDGEIQQIIEKPVETHLVNAGIYVFDPEILQFVPKETLFDMPDLLEILIKESKKVVPFPVHEYWLDVGNPENLLLANLEWKK